jgi:site-specific DNA-cytosine methylase
MIAGTSCVDFSRLNSHTKKITDNGESGDTFRSLVEYLVRFRPAICIVENVKSAPWKEIQGILSNDFEGLSANSQEHYSGIWKDGDRAYAAKVVQLDTKDYYIPQTRQRGYLVAIDRKYEDADTAVDEWVRKLEDLEQRASSPVESFLSEDTVATDMSNSPAFIKKHGREVDWDICYARHQEYRISSGLGTRRPLTQWVRGGSCTGPDHWQLDWVRAQVERVWDTLDVCHLRNAQRGFDDSYKMYDNSLLRVLPSY